MTDLGGKGGTESKISITAAAVDKDVNVRSGQGFLGKSPLGRGKRAELSPGTKENTTD